MAKLRALLSDPGSTAGFVLFAVLVWMAIGAYDTLLVEAMRPYLPSGAPTPLGPGGRLVKHALLFPFVFVALRLLDGQRARGWARMAMVLVASALVIGVLERMALNLVGVATGAIGFDGMGFLVALGDWVVHDPRLFLRSIAQSGASFAITALALAARAAALEAFAAQRQANEVRVAALNARLAALENELSPHFLFNALHHAVARTEEPATQGLLVDLAELLRYVLEGRDRPRVTLEEELEFSRAYLALCVQQGAAVEVVWREDAAAAHALVPRMLLHLIVENAFRHAAEVKPGGSIAITIDASGGRLRLEVENDHREGSDLAGAGVGLSNARERLAILFGERAELVAGASGPGRWRTVVVLPLEVAR
jgi:hypothetical protein